MADENGKIKFMPDIDFRNLMNYPHVFCDPWSRIETRVESCDNSPCRFHTDDRNYSSNCVLKKIKIGYGNRETGKCLSFELGEEYKTKIKNEQGVSGEREENG